jgi:hypothetical protein
VSQIQIISVIAAVIIVSALAFQAGRETATPEPNCTAIKRADSSASASSKANIRAGLIDQHNVILVNLATVPFGELYDLISGASPEKRVSWAKKLESLSSGPRKLAAIESFYKTLVQLDPRSAIQLVLEIKTRPEQKIAIAAVLGTVREADLKLAAEMLIALPAFDRRGLFGSFMSEWIQVDPAGAIEFIQRDRDHLSSDELYSVMWSWAEHDPMTARDWLDRLDAEQQTSNVIRGVVLGWYQRDPAAALGYAAARTDSKQFCDVVDEIAIDVVRDREEKAADFVKDMPTSAKEALVNAVIRSPKTRHPVLSTDEVVRWLVELPDSMWTGRVDGLLSTWEKNDGEDTLAWIEQLSEEKRAQLLSEHAPQGEKIPRERIFSLASEISDFKLRETALRKFATSLGKTRDERLHSLQSLNVSAAQKHYLRSLLNPE